jgi:hypothetical protein
MRGPLSRRPSLYVPGRLASVRLTHVEKHGPRRQHAEHSPDAYRILV